MASKPRTPLHALYTADDDRVPLSSLSGGPRLPTLSECAPSLGLLQIDASNAALYRLPADDQFPNGAGPVELLETLLARGAGSVDINWVQNHYRWIVWKFASLERRFAEK